MQQPSTIKIDLKLLKFQNEVDVIKKDASNPHFKSRYASLYNMLSETKPLLNALKCIITQPIIDNKVYTIVTDTESGEYRQSWVELPPSQNPQAAGSAITYFRRYTLAALLALEIEEDDDGNTAAQHNTSASNGSEKQWLNKHADKAKTQTTETWEKVVASLHNGYTLEQVEKKYKINKELKEELEAIIKSIHA
jgi:hypothetical protein